MYQKSVRMRSPVFQHEALEEEYRQKITWPCDYENIFQIHMRNYIVNRTFIIFLRERGGRDKYFVTI